jgi:hypothetical protein
MQSPITIDQGNVITRNYTPFHFAGYNQTYNAQITYSDHSSTIFPLLFYYILLYSVSFS